MFAAHTVTAHAMSPNRARTNHDNKYKTKLCDTWAKCGECRYGKFCHFAHGLSELRAMALPHNFRTVYCDKFSRDGTCPYGYRCMFIHAPTQGSSISQHFIEEVKGHHAFKWFPGRDDSIAQFLPSCLTL